MFTKLATNIDSKKMWLHIVFDVSIYLCIYIRLKQLTNRNIDNTDNKRKSKR